MTTCTPKGRVIIVDDWEEPEEPDLKQNMAAYVSYADMISKDYDEAVKDAAKSFLETTIDRINAGDEGVDFKFDEDKLLNEVLEYIKSTYSSHYAGEKYQATDLIIDAGHGVGFCIGNIIKYAKRYGKKDGYNEKDLMKILHYAVILLYVHREKLMENA